jgi:hypothetical protein
MHDEAVIDCLGDGDPEDVHQPVVRRREGGGDVLVERVLVVIFPDSFDVLIKVTSDRHFVMPVQVQAKVLQRPEKELEQVK